MSQKRVSKIMVDNSVTQQMKGQVKHIAFWDTALHSVL